MTGGVSTAGNASQELAQQAALTDRMLKSQAKLQMVLALQAQEF